MKFFYLVVVLLFFFINYCSAATNRSTAWLFADSQIFSTDKKWQPCKPIANYETSSILKTKSDYITITGVTAANPVKAPPSATALDTTMATTDTSAQFTSITIAFKITDGGATITKTFTLAAFTTAALMSNQINFLTGGIWIDSDFSGDIDATLDSVTSIDTQTIRTSSGAVWLYIEKIGSYDEGAATTSSVSWRAVQITDYQSNSTLAVIAWQDGDDGAGAKYNHFYMVSVRSATENFDSGLMVDGCSSERTSKRRRNVRASALTSCPLSTNTYSDSSIEDNKDDICTFAASTGSYFGNAVTVGGKVMDLVRATDDAYFGAAGSKFSIAANFGVLIAMSSIIFSILN